MTPQTWADVINYVLLALGGAMAIGTGMALYRFHQTGVFPGQPLDDDGTPVGEVSVTSAWVRVLVGSIVALWGLAGLVDGSVIGFG